MVYSVLVMSFSAVCKKEVLSNGKVVCRQRIMRAGARGSQFRSQSMYSSRFVGNLAGFMLVAGTYYIPTYIHIYCPVQASAKIRLKAFSS